MDPTSPMLTLRDILKRCPGYRLHQIKYAVDEYQIEPQARAGIIRLWSEADIATIQAALRRIASRRGGVR